MVQYVPIRVEVLDSPKIMKLPAEGFRFWLLFLLAAQKWDFVDGVLPDVARLAYWVRCTEAECAEALFLLAKAGLVDQIEGGWRVHDWHDWRHTSDSKSTPRVQKHRQSKKKETETQAVVSPALHETLHETPRVTSETLHETQAETHETSCNVSVERPETDVEQNVTPSLSLSPSFSNSLSKQAGESHACEPAPAREIVPTTKTDPEWEPQPIPDESMSGRSGKDHADFVRACRILDSHHTTRRLANELRMTADTPGVQMLRGWQLVCGALTCQRPDKGKTWGGLMAFSRNATEAEYDRLSSQAPARTSGVDRPPPKTAEQMQAELEESNRKFLEYQAKQRTNR